MSEDIHLKLKPSSWENLFHVLKWCGSPELQKNVRDHYEKSTGKHFTLGNFWAAVHDIERQYEEKVGRPVR